MVQFKGSKVLTIAVLTFCLVSECVAFHCSLKGDNIFLCTGITSDDYNDIPDQVAQFISTQMEYSVYFASCDFAQQPAIDTSFNWFKGHEKITAFTCEDCSIDSFPLPFMYNMGNIMTKINITFSTLNVIKDAGNNPPLPFRNSLTTMEFYQNKWNILAPDPGNPQIAANAFASYVSLITLDFWDFFADSPPNAISPYAFANENVQTLDLSYADLGTHYVLLPAMSKIFSNLYEVTYISIYGNDFNSLAKDTFSLDSDKQPKLKLLSLEGNPWECNCALQWLKDFINNNQQVVTVDHPKCSENNMEFNDTDFGCPTEETDNDSAT